MEANVETHDESGGAARQDEFAPLRIRLFGPLRVEAGARELPLPASRKVRALLALLLLAPRPVPRSRLCDLFWDAASDPRGELRWCLAKLRTVLDGPAQARLIADGDRVAIDASDLDVDAIRFARSVESAVASDSVTALHALLGLVEGELLEGLVLARCDAVEQWLAAERARFARWHRLVLDRLMALLPAGGEPFVDVARRRAALCPLDAAVQLDLIGALAAAGGKAEADQARAAAVRRFQREGLQREALMLGTARAPAAMLRPAACIEGAKTEAIPIERPAADPMRRASIVVLPFTAASPDDADLARGLTHDVTLGLAKMRSLMVIARGTAFALPARSSSAQHAGEQAGVDYVAGGALAKAAGRLRITVELTATASGRIVWVDDFAAPSTLALDLLDVMTQRIVSVLDAEVHLVERNRALSLPPESLDAWLAYHRGLWHMYWFRAEHNDAAQSLFRRAVALDPSFAPAYSGLSFTHFQNAFLLESRERQAEVDRALDTAGQALMADSLDPSAHWAMGRALWLRGDDDASFRALDQSVALSPNFALGHYARAFVHSQTGDPAVAISAADTSHQLSPFDPLLFAIHASRVFSLLRQGRAEDAADAARHVVEQRNVHVHARAISALALAAADRVPEARAQLDAIRRERAPYAMDDFLSAFRVAPELETICRAAAVRAGLN
ncbi:MAG TPA: transcriptional regulator [Albitalea sp.]|nr:transcriptional regulator [Albitalea sp.]